jgi:uncharacterized protein (DUF2267 family)
MSMLSRGKVQPAAWFDLQKVDAMSATGLEVFDKTLHATNVWLKEIGEGLGTDRQRSYEALRAVLFAMRDRLPVDEAADLASQLPMLIRGIFYEGYKPSGKPERIRSREEFLERIAEPLKRSMPHLNEEEIALAVLKVLQHHIAKGELEDVKQALPQKIRSLFSE